MPYPYAAFSNPVLKQNFGRLAILGALLALLTTLYPGALRAASDGNLSPEATMRRILEQRDNPDFVLLDVRTPGEYRKGHIQGAKLLDYYHQDFLKRLETLDLVFHTADEKKWAHPSNCAVRMYSRECRQWESLPPTVSQLQCSLVEPLL